LNFRGHADYFHIVKANEARPELRPVAHLVGLVAQNQCRL
jgi:hypothetical protein